MNYRVIANLFLLLFLGVADNQVIAALLPPLVDSLKITVASAGLLVMVYSLDTGGPNAWSGMANRWPARDRPGALGWRRGS